MKLKTLFVVALLTVSASAVGEGTFCEGFRHGWADVWKDKMLVVPTPPYCPRDDGGAGSHYNRGYRKGAAKAESTICKKHPSNCK